MRALQECLRLIASDYRRYQATSRGKAHPLSIILLTQGFWAGCMYRFAHYVYKDIQLPVVSKLLRIGMMFVQKGIEILSGICLPAECEIGAGLYIGHFGGIIINGNCKLGRNCNLSQGVTIGMMQSGPRQGVPVIEDRVYIGPHAIIIGNIHIGNDAAIGAGSVVIHSVPERGVVAGNPARLISQKGSFDYIHYNGMENDQARNHSLQSVECDSSIQSTDGGEAT